MGFAMPHVAVLAAAACMVVAEVFQIVGVAATGWVSYETIAGKGSSGLWKICANAFGSTVCGDWQEVPSWLEAVRAFGILGIFAMALALACVLLLAFMGDKKIFGLIAPIAAAAGGACALIEFAVYADKTSARVDGVNYDYCFALTIVACILCLAAAVLFFLGRRRS